MQHTSFIHVKHSQIGFLPFLYLYLTSLAYIILCTFNSSSFKMLSMLLANTHTNARIKVYGNTIEQRKKMERHL